MKRNREDQIARAAFDFGLDYPKGVKHDSIVIDECFRAGAKWADEHPFEVTDDILQDNILEIECECGNTFKYKLPKELEWEETDANERELGTERCYEAKFTCNCLECVRGLIFTCQAWEYPEGKLDMLNIICDHAIVLNEISDLDLKYPFINYEEEV